MSPKKPLAAHRLRRRPKPHDRGPAKGHLLGGEPLPVYLSERRFALLRSVFGANVRRLRQEQKITQARLCAACGLTVPRLSRIELGRGNGASSRGRIPHVVEAYMLAIALGTTIEELFEGEG